MTENAVAVRREQNLTAGASLSAIIPRDVDEAWRLSGAVVSAGLVPKSYEGRNDGETRSKVMIGIMKGMEVGLPPVTALSTICIINNRPSVWGDGAIALAQASGKVEWMRETIEGQPGTDDWMAVCEIKRAGQSESYRRTFSFGQARRAKLTTKPGPWMAYPERMMQMRARAFALRDGFSDVLCGLGIVEEQQDIPAAGQKVDTAFLDDDAPAEPVAAIEHQPMGDEQIARDLATMGREALDMHLAMLPEDRKAALPLDDLFAQADAADAEREADATE